MGIEMVIGLFSGAFLIWFGYIVQANQIFPFFAGLETWEPVNRERLGNRVGILIVILGVIAILASIFTIWFGVTVGKISGVFAIIDVIMIIIVVGLDQMGY